MRRALLGLVAVAVGAGGLTAAGGDVSPVGKPKVEADTVRKFYIWCDPDYTEWHLRTTSKGKGKTGVHEFAGTVSLTGGRFRNVTANKTEDKGKTADFWELKDNGRTLEFKLRTGKAVDGLNFDLTPNTREILFDLTIDGERNGKQVRFGKEARSLGLSKVFFKLR